jgi:hypothetical protein
MLHGIAPASGKSRMRDRSQVQRKDRRDDGHLYIAIKTCCRHPFFSIARRNFMRRTLGLILFMIGLGAQPPAQAQTQNCRQEFLEIADGICGEFVALSGSSTTNSGSLGVNARINGLLGRLVDIGGEATVGRQAEYYENILQADLPKVLNQGAQCRLEVTRLLFDKICGTTAIAQPQPAPAPQGRTWLLARQASDAPGCEIQPVAVNGVLPEKVKFNRGVYFWTVNQNSARWRILTMNGTYADLDRNCLMLVGSFGPQVPWKDLTQPARLKPALGYPCYVFPKPPDDGPLLHYGQLVEDKIFHSTQQQGNHWYVRNHDGKVGVAYAGCIEFLRR